MGKRILPVDPYNVLTCVHCGQDEIILAKGHRAIKNDLDGGTWLPWYGAEAKFDGIGGQVAIGISPIKDLMAFRHIRCHIAHLMATGKLDVLAGQE